MGECAGARVRGCEGARVRREAQVQAGPATEAGRPCRTRAFDTQHALIGGVTPHQQKLGVHRPAAGESIPDVPRRRHVNREPLRG